jgi:hypothetical protein
MKTFKRVIEYGYRDQITFKCEKKTFIILFRKKFSSYKIYFYYF